MVFFFSSDHLQFKLQLVKNKNKIKEENQKEKKSHTKWRKSTHFLLQINTRIFLLQFCTDHTKHFNIKKWMHEYTFRIPHPPSTFSSGKPSPPINIKANFSLHYLLQFALYHPLQLALAVEACKLCTAVSIIKTLGKHGTFFERAHPCWFSQSVL